MKHLASATGMASDSFIPTLRVSITLTNNPDQPNVQVTLQCIRIFSNVPNALWQKLDFDSHGTPILDDPLNNTTIPNVISGYKVIAIPLIPDHTLPINLEYLKYTIDPNAQYFSWSTAYVPTSDDFSHQTVEDTIMNTTAVANRAELLPVIHQYIEAVATTVNVDSMTNSTHASLLSQPVLSLLGEERT